MSNIGITKGSVFDAWIAVITERMENAQSVFPAIKYVSERFDTPRRVVHALAYAEMQVNEWEKVQRVQRTYPDK